MKQFILSIEQIDNINTMLSHLKSLVAALSVNDHFSSLSDRDITMLLHLIDDRISSLSKIISQAFQ